MKPIPIEFRKPTSDGINTHGFLIDIIPQSYGTQSGIFVVVEVTDERVWLLHSNMEFKVRTNELRY